MVSSSRQAMVSIQDLSKVYLLKERQGFWRSRERAIAALQNINLEVTRGEVFGLLGPNGAGKTTLIKCLTTLLLPTSGEIMVNGYDTARAPDAARASMGCMLMGERGLYWKLTGRENLEYFGALHYLPLIERRKRAIELIDLLNLGTFADRAVESYSSGQKMKLAFARALIHPAPLLVLDEPTNTLDLPSARELRALVHTLHQQGRTVIYTTHQMYEAEELCDRVAIIDRGRVRACGTVAALKRSLQPQEASASSAVVRVEGVIPDAAYQAVKQLALVREAALSSCDGQGELRVVSDQPRQVLPELIHTLYTHGALIENISPVQVTLEDVFLALTGRTLAENTDEHSGA